MSLRALLFVALASRVAAECNVATCFGASCDYWYDMGYSCESSETDYGCDCSGCVCGGGAPPQTCLGLDLKTGGCVYDASEFNCPQGNKCPSATQLTSPDGVCVDAPDTIVQQMIGADGCGSFECDGNLPGVTDYYQGNEAFIEVVKTLCPVKCGGCDTYCDDKDSFVNAWQSFSSAMGPTCATAAVNPDGGQAVYCLAEYQLGCAASYGLCPQCDVGEVVPSPAPIASPVPMPSPMPSPHPDFSPAPVASPSPDASPSPSPDASPSPSPDAGCAHILDADCEGEAGPPSPPPSPPPYPPAMIVVSIVAEGVVDDYQTPEMISSLKEKFALAVSEDVSPDDVSLEITGASVNIEATIALSGAGISTADAAESLSVSLSDPETASALLGIDVAEIGSLITPPMPPPPPYPPGFGTESAALSGAVVGGAVGGAVGGLAIVALIVALIFFKSKSGGQGSTKQVEIKKAAPPTDVAKTDLQSSKV